MAENPYRESVLLERRPAQNPVQFPVYEQN